MKQSWLAMVAAVLVAAGACGGESSDDGSGGSGAHAGDAGTGATGGTGGTSGIGGAAGMAGCGGSGASDCVNPCTNQFYSPTCVDGDWICDGPLVCDGGADAHTSDCPDGSVPTVHGCLTCEQAFSELASAIESARKASAACNTAADCVTTDASTPCAGACPVAVSKAGESGFSAALTQISADYCSDFVSECGYSTPKCALPTLVCQAGLCEAEYK